MTIDEKSRISFFAVLSSLPFVIAGIVWLTTIDNKASAANEELKGVRSLVLEVRERVIRIEEFQKKQRR